jgi:hypothetical protein
MKASFCEQKEAKKPFLNWAVLASAPRAQISQKFLHRFFQKAASSYF